MKRYYLAATVVGTLTLGGCAGSPSLPDAPLIQIAEFVNSLKCEFATFLVTADGKRLDLRGWSIEGTMELNVATVESIDAGVKMTGLVPFQGASTDIGFGASVARKYTTATSIGFVLYSDALDNRICQVAGPLLMHEGIGVGDWLTGVVENLNLAAAGDPKFAVNKLNYQEVFALERSANANGSLTMIPIAVTAKALASRNDVQTIKIEFNPPEEVIGPKRKDGTDPPKRKKLKPFGPGPGEPLSPMVLPPL